MPRNRASTGLRTRVGAWCARIVSRVGKQHKEPPSSPATENESWITTARHRSIMCGSTSSPRTQRSGIDGAPSFITPRSVRRTTSTVRSSNCRTSATSSMTATSLRRRRPSQASAAVAPSITQTTGSRDSADSIDDARLTLIASQRLRAAGLYAQAEHLKQQQQRELALETRMLQPLHHIQVRRRLVREKQDLSSAATSIAPAFVRIRKAELSRDAQWRLKLLGFHADDSVPPWLPTAAVPERWSCDVGVGMPVVPCSDCDRKIEEAAAVLMA